MPQTSTTPQAVVLGESLGLCRAEAIGPLAPGSATTFSIAGAESNVAIGLARLGHRVAVAGRVGDDPVGQVVADTLRGEGVDLSGLVADPAAPTAFMLRQRRTADRTVVTYFRTGSAGSRLTHTDVPESLLHSAEVLHTTGITLALSASARDAAGHAIAAARSAGTAVSLDVNHRDRLWSHQEARSALTPLLGQVDVLFGSEAELRLLTGRVDADAETLAALLSEQGPEEVVVKRGAHGALARVGGKTFAVDAVPVTSVDPVGAGDAFVAGYLSARLDGQPPGERLRRGALCGAFVVSVPGDWEGLPRRHELPLLDSPQDVHR